VHYEKPVETYAIQGMTCQHCVRAVEKALGKVQGVSRVLAVDLDRAEATIEGSPDEQAVVAAIRAEGYEARRL
jgi:copper chaperone